MSEKLTESFTIRLTPDPQLQKDHHTLSTRYKDLYKPQEVVRESLKTYIRGFKDEEKLAEEDIEEVKHKINKVESKIKKNEEKLTTLQRELKNLEEWKEEVGNKKLKGDDPIMRVISVATRLKIELGKGNRPSEQLLMKYSQETRLAPATISKMGMAYYMGAIGRKDLEKLTPESLRYLDDLEEINRENLDRIRHGIHQTTLPTDIRS